MLRRLVLLVCAVLFVDTIVLRGGRARCCRYTPSELGPQRRPRPGSWSPPIPPGTLVVAIPSGIVAARFGAQPTVLIGLNLLGASSGVRVRRQDVVLLDVARFVQGAWRACSWAGGLAWLVAAAPPQRHRELTGTALGAAIVGALLRRVVGGHPAVASVPEPVFGPDRGRPSPGPVWRRAPRRRSQGGAQRASRSRARRRAAPRVLGPCGSSRSRPWSSGCSTSSCRCGWTTSAPGPPRSARRSSRPPRWRASWRAGSDGRPTGVDVTPRSAPGWPARSCSRCWRRGSRPGGCSPGSSCSPAWSSGCCSPRRPRCSATPPRPKGWTSGSPTRSATSRGPAGRRSAPPAGAASARPEVTPSRSRCSPSCWPARSSPSVVSRRARG